jgi:hypothetical protein
MEHSRVLSQVWMRGPDYRGRLCLLGFFYSSDCEDFSAEETERIRDYDLAFRQTFDFRLISSSDTLNLAWKVLSSEVKNR